MNIEENTESIQKEILQHKIKVMGKDWVQNRLEAKEQVQDMKKHLNSLSEEEAHRQAVEQAEKIKRLREERRIKRISQSIVKKMDNGKEKLFWIDVQSSFVF